MNKKQFTSLLPIKIEGALSLIIENDRLNFADALLFLYQSKLYKKLELEETKLWHLSNHKLYSMLNEEKLTGNFKYPDYV